MTGPGPKSPSQDNPVKVAFYGLTASELDLFTLVARKDGLSLAFVVDPGPMGLARGLAEIAGVRTSQDPWDLVGASLDWLVIGGLVHTRGGAVERILEGGTLLIEAADLGAEIRKLIEVRPAPEPLVPVDRTIQTPEIAVPDEEIIGEVAEDVPAVPALPETEIERVGTKPMGPAELPQEPTPVAAGDETETERIIPLPAGPAKSKPESDGRVAAQRDDASLREPAVPAVAKAEETSQPEQMTPAAAQATPGPRVEIERIDLEREPVGREATLQPLQAAVEPSAVVNWALAGLLSSVHGRWGVALARAQDNVCFVEKGIDIKENRPDLWQWLSRAVSGEGASADAPGAPPQNAGTLAWTLLRAEAGLVGAMLLGREEGSDPFSSADRTWVERLGERVASILSYTSGSDLGSELDEDREPPASVWAGPVIDRARWARAWVRRQLNAKECWLFMAPGGTPVPQLVDEKFGSAGAPILQEMVQEALERRDPQVWLEKDGDRALVLQPLGPWGAKGVILLEGVPWRGDGMASLARLKKAAATIGKLLSRI